MKNDMLVIALTIADPNRPLSLDLATGVDPHWRSRLVAIRILQK